MEVSIFEAVGLPEGAILSVRAGSTRRQAPVPLAGPLRFPNLPFNAKQFKVDVMQTLGSSKVEINANKELESYSVAVDVGNGQQARVGFTVREQPSLCGKRACELKQVDKNPEGILEEPAAMQLPPEKARAALDSRSYAREHNIPNLVQEMLQHVLREKPDAPFTVMSDYFKRKGEEMGEKSEGIKPLGQGPAAALYSPAAPPQQAPQYAQPPPAAPLYAPAAAAPQPAPPAPAPQYSQPAAPQYYQPPSSQYAPAAAPAAVPQQYAPAAVPQFAPPPAAGQTSGTVGSTTEKTLAAQPLANTEAMIASLNPARQAEQRKLQSQMTHPGEFYVPIVPGEDYHSTEGKPVFTHLPLPSDFPEDPAAHIMQKAPPPPPGVDPLPPPGAVHAHATVQAAPPPPPAYPCVGFGAEVKAVPPPLPEKAAPPSFQPAPPSAQKAAPPPAYGGPPALPAELKSLPPRTEPLPPLEKVSPPTSKAALRGETDPERLQLEAEHLSLQAEKASLLRELEILSMQQGVPAAAGVAPGARAP